MNNNPSIFTMNKPKVEFDLNSISEWIFKDGEQCYSFDKENFIKFLKLVKQAEKK